MFIEKKLCYMFDDGYLLWYRQPNIHIKLYYDSIQKISNCFFVQIKPEKLSQCSFYNIIIGKTQIKVEIVSLQAIKHTWL